MARLAPLLVPDVSILEVGAGRSPFLKPSARPPRCQYVGLDVSGLELAAAGPGAFDGTLVADIGDELRLSEQFDVVISWQVLEHVRPIDRAVENLRHALRPGGTLLAQFSGSFALFAVFARMIPHRVRTALMARYLGHPPTAKFPTYYDRCYPKALLHLLAPWSHVEILPFYRGARYLDMARPLQRTYLIYENFLERHAIQRLATHFLLEARR